MAKGPNDMTDAQREMWTKVAERVGLDPKNVIKIGAGYEPFTPPGEEDKIQVRAEVVYWVPAEEFRALMGEL